MAKLAIAEFLSTDIVQKHDAQVTEKRSSLPVSMKTSSPTKSETTLNLNAEGQPTKEGYLTKRGKNYGGWQARYFVLDSPQLRYYDTVCPSIHYANLA